MGIGVDVVPAKAGLYDFGSAGGRTGTFERSITPPCGAVLTQNDDIAGALSPGICPVMIACISGRLGSGPTSGSAIDRFRFPSAYKISFARVFLLASAGDRPEAGGFGALWFPCGVEGCGAAGWGRTAAGIRIVGACTVLPLAEGTGLVSRGAELEEGRGGGSRGTAIVVFPTAGSGPNECWAPGVSSGTCRLSSSSISCFNGAFMLSRVSTNQRPSDCR